MNRSPNTPTDPAPDDDPALQGEGNYSAARRHRKSVKDFISKGLVERAARGAAPRSREEAEAMQDAEVEGRSHGRR
jgi:hypothetical protein